MPNQPIRATRRLKTFVLKQDLAWPAECPLSGAISALPDAELAESEAELLVSEGVWEPFGTPGADRNWAKTAEDGSVWAGTLLLRGRKIAKVKGPNGRRIGGGRHKYGIDEKRVITTVTLLPATIEKLDRLVARAAKAEGRPRSRSLVIEELINAQKEPRA